MANESFRFLDHVFPEEYEVIRRRRGAVAARLREAHSGTSDKELAGPDATEDNSDSPDREDSAPVTPGAERDLVGLAFSGGGIRSATFNLGLLQSLEAYGVLLQVDLMSTVSGGGYLGSSLTAAMRKPQDPFPFLAPENCKVPPPPSGGVPTEPGPETPALRFLREHSNYLTPNGASDWLRIGAILIRGILLNAVILGPALVLVATLFAVVHGDLLRGALGLGVLPLPLTESFHATLTAIAITAAYFALSPIITRRLAAAQPKYPGVGHPDHQQSRGRLGRIADGLVARLLDASDGEADQRINWLALRLGFERSLGLAITINALVFVVELQPVMLHLFHQLADLGSRDIGAGVIATGSAIASVFMRQTSSAFGRIGATLGPSIAGALGLSLPLLGYLLLAELLVYDLHAVQLLGQPIELVMTIGALFVALYSLLFIDINQHSVHDFYRDALARAYLVGLDLDGQLGPEDDLQLSDTALPGSIAPYHLVNTALNLQGEQSLTVSGRRADFFLFSKRFIGSERTGYCPTEVVEETIPHINLGTAMAISAAAASPNMGSFTIGPLVQLMTVFNIRLGYWAPNPERLRQSHKLDANNWNREHWLRPPDRRRLLRRKARTIMWTAGPAFLVAEMRGALKSTGRMVNVSDGGHLENLGVYELLRRRCRWVIVGDGEADPSLTFGAVATIQRFARIDLGVEIDIDLSDLAGDEAGLSRQHAAIGRIRYPARPDLGLEAFEGTLLYVKATVAGDEAPLITQYRATSPSFPHESTADQFFDERQFEAYRSLGFHIGEELFGRSIRPDERTLPGLKRDVLHHVFTRLETLLEPFRPLMPESDSLRQRLDEVEARLDDPEMSAYLIDIPPYMAPTEGTGASAEMSQGRLLTMVQAQLRVMEEAYETLGLQDETRLRHSGNAGWLNRMHRWSRSEMFRWGYAMIFTSLPEAFRGFCAREFDLDLGVEWSEASAEQVLKARVIEADALHTLVEFSRGPVPFLIAHWTLSGRVTTPPVLAGWAWSGQRQDVEGVMTHGLAPGCKDRGAYRVLVRGLLRRESQERSMGGLTLADLDPGLSRGIDLGDLRSIVRSDVRSSAKKPGAGSSPRE